MLGHADTSIFITQSPMVCLGYDRTLTRHMRVRMSERSQSCVDSCTDLQLRARLSSPQRSSHTNLSPVFTKIRRRHSGIINMEINSDSLHPNSRVFNTYRVWKAKSWTKNGSGRQLLCFYSGTKDRRRIGELRTTDTSMVRLFRSPSIIPRRGLCTVHTVAVFNDYITTTFCWHKKHFNPSVQAWWGGQFFHVSKWGRSLNTRGAQSLSGLLPAVPAPSSWRRARRDSPTSLPHRCVFCTCPETPDASAGGFPSASWTRWPWTTAGRTLSDPFHGVRKVSVRRVSPGPLLGFVVHFCDDSIFLVHEVAMNFLQLPDVPKNISD